MARHVSIHTIIKYLSKMSHQMWHNHPFSENNKATKRAVGWRLEARRGWTKFEKEFRRYWGAFCETWIKKFDKWTYLLQKSSKSTTTPTVFNKHLLWKRDFLLSINSRYIDEVPHLKTEIKYNSVQKLQTFR